MVEVHQRAPGNPSGSHRWAREARRRLDDARDVVADLVGARPGEVVFTSGGTEADNLAVRGVVAATGGWATASAVEHHAVIEPVLATGGALLAVDGHGRVLVDGELTRPDGEFDRTDAPTLVSVMAVNNETGVINDLATVAAAVARRWPGAVLHTDAVAAAAWFDLRKMAAPAGLVSISGHKLGGPKGIGALVVRGGTPLAAQITGGGQERERRSGTPDVAGAVGLAMALTVVSEKRDQVSALTRTRSGRLAAGLLAAIPGSVLTVGDLADWYRSPATVHLCIPGVERQSVVFLADRDGVAASWGSSCASGAPETSHVLAAMGVEAELAAGSLRLSLGWSTTDADIDRALEVIPAAVARLRAGSEAELCR